MPSSFCCYKTKTRNELRRGIVVDFLRFGIGALRSMKRDLELHMTIGELQLCQKYFRETERRAPTLDEIYLLDEIANGHHREGTMLSISRFYLNDPVIVETYRDLLNKKRSICKSYSEQPPRLSELSQVLSSVLSRSGRPLSPNTCCLASDESSSLLLSAAGMLPMETLALGDGLPVLRLFEKNRNASSLSEKQAHPDDALVVLHDLNKAQNGYLDRVATFARTEIYKKTVHAYRVVGESGLAAALLSLHRGIYIELDKIPDVFDGGELYDLALAEHGTLLIAISRDQVSRVIEAAAPYGLLAVQIARASKGNRLTIRREGYNPVSLHTDLILALANAYVPFLLEGESHRTDKAPLTEGAFVSAPSPELVFQDPKSERCIKLNEQLFTAAGCTDCSFQNGIHAAVRAFLNAVLNGADPNKINASDLYAYPEEITSASMGDVFEAFLGVYRTFAELSIPTSTSFLPKNDRRGFSVFCSADLSECPPIPDRFSVPNSSVYLITLPKKETGLPDFAALRSLSKMLFTLRKGGHLRSYSLAQNASPLSVVEGMSADFEVRFGEIPSFEMINSEMTELFLILESDVEISGCTRIGTVRRVQGEALSEASSPSAEISPSSARPISKRPVEHPLVLLLPLGSFEGVHLLKKTLQEAGCDVRISADGCDRDHAQIVICCGASDEHGRAKLYERISEDPRNLPAIEAFLAHDGILLINDALSAALTAHSIPVISLQTADSFIGSAVYSYTNLTTDTLRTVLGFYH